MKGRSLFSKIVSNAQDLPSMPQVANLAIDKLSDPHTTPREVHLIISKDQALAARILRVANSAYYSSPRKISKISDAINYMGFDSVKSLVIASVIEDLFKKSGLAEKLLWDHSLACGAAAKKLAAAVKFRKAEEAFLAGLMHDIGKVVLSQKVPDEMLQIVQEVYNSPGTDFVEIEQARLGFTHADVGRFVAKKWNFAEEIEEAIGNHHHPEEASILPVLSHITCLANAICNKLEIGPVRMPDLDLMAVPSSKILGLDRETIDTISEDLFTAGMGV